MPGFDWDDFSKPLVDGISMYEGKMVGIPFDIPIFILMYRKDLYDKHGIKVPTTMDEYMAAVKAIDAAERSNGIYGTTGQLKSGHYSLNCDWTAWLWAQGRLDLRQEQDVLRRRRRRHRRASNTCWSWSSTCRPRPRPGPGTARASR